MSIHGAGFIVICDLCGVDGGDTKQTWEDAREWAACWEIQGSAGSVGGVRHACDDCSEELGTT